MDNPDKLTRVSLSLENSLCARLDALVDAAGARNRSDYVRDMIRTRLVDAEWLAGDAPVLATVTLLYDHHQRELCARLTEIQHDADVRILAATHVHLSHERCAEMIMVVGIPDEIRKLYCKLKEPKGILHAALSAGSTGDNL